MQHSLQHKHPFPSFLFNPPYATHCHVQVPRRRAAGRTLAATQFKRDIEALPSVIPTIRHIHVGVNINPAEQWDICLTSTFDSLADAQAYGAHPAHQAVAGALKPLLAGRACVDME